jgi:hypothetical protein
MRREKMKMNKEKTQYQDIREKCPNRGDWILLVDEMQGVSGEWERSPRAILGTFVSYLSNRSDDIAPEYAKKFFLKSPRVYENCRNQIIGEVSIPDPHFYYDRHRKFSLNHERIYVGPTEIKRAFLEDEIVKQTMFPIARGTR